MVNPSRSFFAGSDKVHINLCEIRPCLVSAAISFSFVAHVSWLEWSELDPLVSPFSDVPQCGGMRVGISRPRPILEATCRLQQIEKTISDDRYSSVNYHDSWFKWHYTYFKCYCPLRFLSCQLPTITDNEYFQGLSVDSRQSHQYSIIVLRVLHVQIQLRTSLTNA